MKLVKNLTLYLCLLLLVFVAGIGITVGFFFLGYHFGNREQFEVSSIVDVTPKDDVTYTFTGSNIAVPVVYRRGANNDYVGDNVFSLVQFTLSSSSFSGSFTYYSSSDGSGFSSPPSSSVRSSDFSFSHSEDHLTNKHLTFNASYNGSSYSFYINIYYGYDYSPIGSVGSLPFNFNVVSATLGTGEYKNPFDNTNINNSTSIFTRLVYTDNNGKHFYIFFELNDEYNPTGSIDYISLTERTYYFANSSVSPDPVDPSPNPSDSNYQAGYEQGYYDGSNSSYQTGFGDGYNDGRAVGYDDGYHSGYSAGVLNANDYSFLGLIGAVVDAPVNTFVSLLNFEIFGFNFLSCLTGILTIALIITIVRFILGKR